MQKYFFLFDNELIFSRIDLDTDVNFARFHKFDIIYYISRYRNSTAVFIVHSSCTRCESCDILARSRFFSTEGECANC